MEKESEVDLENKLLDFFVKEGVSTAYVCYNRKDSAKFCAVYNMDDHELVDMIMSIFETNPSVAILMLGRLLLQRAECVGGVH